RNLCQGVYDARRHAVDRGAPRLGPIARLKLNPARVQTRDDDFGRGIRQHTIDGPQPLQNGPAGRLKVGLSRNREHERRATPGIASQVDDATRVDRRVGDDDLAIIARSNQRRPKIDSFYLPLKVPALYLIADAKRPLNE